MSEVNGFREFLETAFGRESAENEFWKKWCLKLKVGILCVIGVAVVDLLFGVYWGFRNIFWDLLVDGVFVVVSLYLLAIIGKFEKQFGYWELKRRTNPDGSSGKTWKFIS